MVDAAFNECFKAVSMSALAHPAGCIRLAEFAPALQGTRKARRRRMPALSINRTQGIR
ncbi:hypothetical protein QYH69_11555 [Paraburkholderia sp. SARCC-3016]|uniref:hypothetical protein n=1 Tax=Paraburkholderia sp. SARCC-3016 TaxID=3058611 RepID=UPI002809AD2A|nr:hypothetical protein [Paraburkholderia sp. SARCC-3016]MDQ7977875.1 hypothetical protein [Paraburkholderia sp. SARCC-3016]